MHRARRGAWIAVTLAFSAALATGCQREPVVVLELVADDLVFRGDNPDISARAGSRVTLLFRNEADGVIHQLAIPGLDLETEILQPGDSAELRFKAPKESTVLTYSCELHALMKGRIVIDDPDSTAAQAPPADPQDRPDGPTGPRGVPTRPLP